MAFTLLLGAMAALPPLSIDMGLPALPQIESALGSSPSNASLTLTVFLAAFACAQLVFGPLSDIFGRRPMLLIGCLLYTAAGIGCAAAPTIGILLACRLLAGAGAGAGIVIAFSIVRDLFEGPDALAKLSYVGMVQGVAPVIAPTLGSGILLLAGWRGIYGLLVLFGVSLTLAIFFSLDESRPLPAAPSALSGKAAVDDWRGGLARALAGYRHVLGNRWCIGHALVGGLSFGSMFAYVSGSPLVFISALGLSPGSFGLLFALTSGGIIVGSAMNGLLSRWGISSAMALGSGLAVLAASALILCITMNGGRDTIWILAPLLILNSFAFGLIVPNAVHAVLEPMPEISGIASSVFGFTQMSCGAVASGAVAWLYAVTGPPAMADIMLVAAVGAVGSWLLIARPSDLGTPRASPQGARLGSIVEDDAA